MVEFDEAEYLRRYTDVASAVSEGLFTSGVHHYQQFGAAEGRWPILSRVEKIFFGLDKSADGLEIGAGYNPLVSGPKAQTLDHLDQDGLIQKYKEDGVDTSKIAPVTYVWKGEPFSEIVHDKFDWIVASHVIEHVPNLIGFVNDCAGLLKPDGVLTLVVPDRRYIFDYFRSNSSLAAIIDANVEKRSKPSIGNIVEHYRMHCGTSRGIAWDSATAETPGFLPDISKEKAEQFTLGEYVDTHVWVFTASWFRLLMLELRQMNFIPLSERMFFDVDGCEFYIQLSRHGSENPLDRRSLALAALAER